MKEYNGHRSWNAWNVALWIENDEILYSMAMGLLREAGNNPNRAAQCFLQLFKDKTPDGATYNQLSVKLALEGLIE